jgi:hypothetical protein
VWAFHRISIASDECIRIHLLTPGTRVMNVVNTENSVKRRLHEMTIFTIDHDNNITAFASAKKADSNPETERFRSAKDLAKLTANWPATRLIEIWNSLPGVSPVGKFTSRQVAIDRIWKAIQNLAPEEGAQAPSVATKRAKAAKATASDSEARVGGKTATVLQLLRRPEGAALAELMAATEWQAHSVRGFLSGTLRKKMGLKIESAKSAAGERRYSIQA